MRALHGGAPPERAHLPRCRQRAAGRMSSSSSSTSFFSAAFEPRRLRELLCQQLPRLQRPIHPAPRALNSRRHGSRQHARRRLLLALVVLRHQGEQPLRWRCRLPTHGFLHAPWRRRQLAAPSGAVYAAPLPRLHHRLECKHHRVLRRPHTVHPPRTREQRRHGCRVVFGYRVAHAPP